MTTFLQQLMLSIHTGRQKNLPKIAVYLSCGERAVFSALRSIQRLEFQ
ncbi:hypothetical protein [Photorhabdus aegyptia]|nr:hypothetical protein [Photorhabdus aegyptia]